MTNEKMRIRLKTDEGHSIYLKRNTGFSPVFSVKS